MSAEPVTDPQGRIYNHRGPGGAWLPGAAGSCGGKIIATWFDGVDLAAWDRAIPARPTGILVYPLVGRGERYPFQSGDAEGFVVGGPGTLDLALYAACLEGVAYVERWGYEVLGDLGSHVTGPIATTGGGARSVPWMQIRADVLGRPVRVPGEPDSAFGAAIIAASAVGHCSVQEAMRRMVRWIVEIQPRATAVPAYADTYRRFRGACAARGYV